MRPASDIGRQWSTGAKDEGASSQGREGATPRSIYGGWSVVTGHWSLPRWVDRGLLHPSFWRWHGLRASKSSSRALSLASHWLRQPQRASLAEYLNRPQRLDSSLIWLLLGLSSESRAPVSLNRCEMAPTTRRIQIAASPQPPISTALGQRQLFFVHRSRT